MLKKTMLFRFIFSLALLYGFAMPVMSAVTTGAIAVIDLQLATPLSVVDDIGDKVSGTIQVFQQHRTPLTKDGDLDLAKIRKTLVALNQRIELERRGSSSLSHPKKNYSLDLKGNASKLLGMPAEKEWVLHSCWADKTCLRNLIGYWQANQLAKGSPRTEFAEVFINDEYRGLYLLVEKIKLGGSRVNLPLVDDNNITGTYIFKRDGDDNNWDWSSSVDPTLNWWFVQPKRKNITPAQINYISNFMNNTVEPMFNPASPRYNPSKYAARVNPKAAMNFIMVHELGHSIDAYWKSMYVTKRRDNRIYMGPIWDMDLSFANGNIAPDTCQTDGWRIENTELTSQMTFQPLKEMWRVPRFRNAFKTHWFNLRNQKIISPSAISSQLRATAHRIKAARARDDKKWQTIGQATWWECSIQPTYLDEVNELNRWILARIKWMDKEIRAMK